MRKSLCLLFLIAAGFLSFGQEIRDANAEKRNVRGFHGIETSTGIRLLLTKGNTEEVVVSADKTEYRDKIITEVVAGILKIRYESKINSVNRRNESKILRAYVSYMNLDRLIVNTGAEMELKNILSASSLDLTVTTGASFKGEVDVNSMKLDQSTGSRVTISGRAEKLEVEGSTGSKLEGEGLKTSSCSVTVSTGARIIITAEKDIKVKAGTGGILKYKGNASISEIKTNTGGTVSKI